MLNPAHLSLHLPYLPSPSENLPSITGPLVERDNSPPLLYISTVVVKALPYVFHFLFYLTPVIAILPLSSTTKSYFFLGAVGYADCFEEDTTRCGRSGVLPPSRTSSCCLHSHLGQRPGQSFWWLKRNLGGINLRKYLPLLFKLCNQLMYCQAF